VTARGNERKTIYRDEVDRGRFLIRLAAVGCRYRWKLHGFVLMRNHYHLLVETTEANLSRGMRQLSSYPQARAIAVAMGTAPPPTPRCLAL